MIFFILIFFLFFKNSFNNLLQNRYDRIIHINSFISKSFKEKDFINNEYSNLLKKYFGLDFSEKKINDEELAYELDLIENNLSNSELLIFDNKIKYIINKSKNLLNKTNDKNFSEIISLSFLASCLLPNKSSPFFYNYINKENFDNQSYYFFEEIFSTFYLLSNHIISLKDNFILDEGEKVFSRICENKNYILYNASSIFLEEKKFKKNILLKNFEKSLNEYKSKYKKIIFEKLKEDFEFFEKENLLKSALSFFLKKETFLTLYLIARIGSNENLSILKIDKNLKSLVAEFSFLARFIIDSFNKCIGEKKINWKNKKLIFLKKETVENFFQSIILFGSLDKIFFRDFLDIFSKK